MRNKLLWTVFAAAASLVVSQALAGEETIPRDTAQMPEWASVLPAETALVFAIEDVESFSDALFPADPSKERALPVERFVALVAEQEPKAGASLRAMTDIVKTLLKALRGTFCLAVDEKPEWPTVYFVGNLKPEVADFAGFLSREVQPLFKKLQVDSVVEKGEGLCRLEIGNFAVHFSTANSRVLGSTDRAMLFRMRDARLPSESALAAKKAFREATAVVAPRGFFGFVDITRLVRLRFGRLSTGTLKALSDMGLDRLESLAFSADIEDSYLKLKFAITNDGKVTGMPEIVLRPNTAIKAARFVPADYSIFLRFSAAGALDAYREWQTIVRRMADDVSWKEYQDALAELRGKRGFGLEDVLGNLGDEVAVAVKLPELVGIPATLALIEVKDREKALDMISRFLRKAGAAPQRWRADDGAIYTTSAVPGMFLSYTVKEGYLIVGLSPSSIVAALKALESGKSIAKEPHFPSAVRASVGESLFFTYVDMRHVGVFLGSLLPWFHAKEIGGLWHSDAFGRRVARMIQRLSLRSERLGYALVCATSGEECLVVQAQIPLGVVRLAFSMLPQPIAVARERARREQCLNNLRQIVLACHTFASDHDDKFPSKLSELYPAYLNSLGLFCCPSTGAVISVREEIDSKSDYKLVVGYDIKDRDATKKVVLYESPQNHRGHACLAFGDGHVRWVDREGFRRLVEEAELETNP